MNILRRTWVDRAKRRLFFYTTIGLVALMLLIVLNHHSPSKESWKEKWMDRQFALKSFMDLPAQKKLKLIRKSSHTNMNLNTMGHQPLSDLQAGMTMHTLLNNIEVICSRKLRIGNFGDGGWEICDDINVRPRKQCVVYSFTINNDFSFDDQMAEIYGCHVYAFDPNMADGVYNRSSHVHVYNGISHLETLKTHPTLAEFITWMGHKNAVIDVVKIDRASAEWWKVYESFFMAGAGEEMRVRQLVVDFQMAPGEKAADDSASVDQRISTLMWLYTYGFRVFDSRKNPACEVKVKGFPFVKTLCYQMSYWYKF